MWKIFKNICIELVCSILLIVLAYYSFNFKLIGFFIIKLNYQQWFSSFSYDIHLFNDFKKEYDINEEKIREFFKNLSIDKDDGYHQNFYTHDYMQYIQNSTNKKI